MAKKLLVANWKENPKTQMEALHLFRGIAGQKAYRGVEVAICPPFIYLEEIAKIHTQKNEGRVALGAQDVFWEEHGPYTSEVGPRMLRSLGVQYVIIGHSERRKWLKETDAMINKKIALALRDGLKVILCVGESASVRRKGFAVAKRFVAQQLKKDLRGIGGRHKEHIIIAYEPVWAIGTGIPDPPEEAVAMASFIKTTLRKAHIPDAPVLYGGSVTGANIGSFVQYKEIGGALVGGASLEISEFKKTIEVTASVVPAKAGIHAPGKHRNKK
jgi:triosephosphate isomerase